LIELLVVIAIIALLMAVLLPTLSRVRKQARAVTCRANLKQWGQVLALYAEDHEGRLPRGGSQPILWILSGRYISPINPKDPVQYHPLRTAGIACCPMAVKPSKRTTTSTSTVRSGGVILYVVEWKVGSTFTAWELVSPAPPFRASYGANSNVFDVQFDGPSHPGYIRRAYTDIFSLRAQGNIPLLFDSCHPSISLFDPNLPPPKREPDGLGTTGDLWMNRHDGTINGLFLDWSVSRIGLKQLHTLKWLPGFNTSGRWTKAGGVKPENWPEWMRKFKDY
jgi:prepilin-type processing-associated H-X9-DG protein